MRFFKLLTLVNIAILLSTCCPLFAQLRFDKICVDCNAETSAGTLIENPFDVEVEMDLDVEESPGLEETVPIKKESESFWELFLNKISSFFKDFSSKSREKENVFASYKSSSEKVFRHSSISTEKIDDLEKFKLEIKVKYGISLLENGSAWNELQLRLSEKVFSSLPDSFLRCTQSIVREPLPPHGKSQRIAAYVRMPQKKIHILDLGVSMPEQYRIAFEKVNKRPPKNKEVIGYIADKYPGYLVHEMTHCFQNANPSVLNAWKKLFDYTESPTKYGKNNHLEDMAESVRLYWSGGRIYKNEFVADSGDVMDIERYNFIKENIMRGREYR